MGGIAGDISNARALAPSTVVLAAMMLIALATSSLTGMDTRGLAAAYLLPAFSVTLIAGLIWTAGLLISLAIHGGDRPSAHIWARLRPALPLLVLPLLIQPLFMAFFTTAKTAMAPLISFSWDDRFAHLDALIFGLDPWRFTFRWLDLKETRVLEMLYTAGWGIGLVFVPAFVAFSAPRRFVGRFFLAMNLCWLVGGIVVAYAMPAAGPVFAHIFEPQLAHRFDDLQTALASHLMLNGPVMRTQAYLVDALRSPLVEAGGGISAMPSIHVTVAILYILAAQRTRWSIPAIVFGLLTFIGSIHFGYHYAIDGFVGMAVAQLCWRCAGLCYDRRRVAIGEPAKSASVSTLPVQGSMSPPEPVSVLVRAA